VSGQHASPRIFLYFGHQVEAFGDSLAAREPIAARLAVASANTRALPPPGRVSRAVVIDEKVGTDVGPARQVACGRHARAGQARISPYLWSFL
jgi:hypothetical protein